MHFEQDIDIGVYKQQSPIKAADKLTYAFSVRQCLFSQIFCWNYNSTSQWSKEDINKH